jgi:tetratricopeptide (TPR) repeat protein
MILLAKKRLRFQKRPGKKPCHTAGSQILWLLITLWALPGALAGAQPAPSISVPASTPHPGGLQRGIDPGQPDPLHLIGKGAELLQKGRCNEAEGYFQEFVQTHPSDPSGYFWLGKVADETGHIQQAFRRYVESLNAAKGLGMDSEELRVNLGNVLLKLGYYKEATYDFQRAIYIDKKNLLAHYSLAKLFLITGQDADALAELSRCTALGLNDPHVTLFRSWGLKRLGQLEESSSEAHRFLDQASPNEPAEIKEFAQSLF